MVKIIALLPVKNEAWCLQSYLSTITKITDHVIALDDNSTDNTRDILESAGVHILTIDTSNEKVVNMSRRRQHLLEAGRSAGGTHFIWLDADETFSADFLLGAREEIKKLRPGQKLTMRWVHPWKNTYHYLTDKKSPFGTLWKDFIICDRSDLSFTNQFLSESRTPGITKDEVALPDTDGVVLHWQFSDWHAVQYKQAWYRCVELVEGSRSPQRINHTYNITLICDGLSVEPLPPHWITQVTVPDTPSGKSDLFLKKITHYFDTYGIKFFEPLQIWHIEELHTLFLETVGREPNIKVFPAWLVGLNALRHKVKDVVRKCI